MMLRAVLIFALATLAVSNARPNHFGDGNQALGEGDSNNNLLDASNLEPWELELVKQQLREPQARAANAVGGWDKDYLRAYVKRQTRYRQCYFNPISCFRK